MIDRPPSTLSVVPAIASDRIDRLIRCVSQVNLRPVLWFRVALEQAYRQLVLAWARGTYDTGKLEAQCTSMLDGLRQAMAATCGR